MPRRTKRQIAVQRAYDPPGRDDGCRVLVDRVWPRGRTREALRLDAWLKDVAPSTALRKWFAHDPAKWQTFKDRYFQELDRRPEAVETLLKTCPEGRLTLVYGATDTRYNNAVALKAYLERH